MQENKISWLLTTSEEAKKSPTAIELCNFSISFYNNKIRNVILDELNYSFEKGKIHFIVGPPSCGKTVLISHMNALFPPLEGKIKIFGEEIKLSWNKKVKNVRELRRKIGIVFQFAEYQLFKPTIQDDIIFGAVNFGIKKNVAISRAKEVLQLVGLDDSFLPRDPFGLSGGQKRRVAIAGILASNPDIIIFDEPTAGLDPKGENDMLSLFSTLRDYGKTIIIVTHTMNHALAIADNIVVINESKIVKSGSPYDVFLDDKVIEKANLSLPLVIKTINKLSAKNSKYKKILDHKPRNVKELIAAIAEVEK